MYSKSSGPISAKMSCVGQTERSDSGKKMPNYAGLVGRAFGATLTPAYYPDNSRDARVVFLTFGTALLGNIGLNAMREFIPGTHF